MEYIVKEIVEGQPQIGYEVVEETPIWDDSYDPKARFTGIFAKENAELYAAIKNKIPAWDLARVLGHSYSIDVKVNYLGCEI